MGSYVDAATGACIKCQQGTFSGSAGSAICALCGAGTYGHAAGVTSCQKCPAGKASSKIGQYECTTCAGGTYARAAGETVCAWCDEGTWSAEGASDCLLCRAGYYDLDPGAGFAQCTPCGKGADCDAPGSSLETLVLRQGFWRAGALSTHILACPAPAHCKGGGPGDASCKAGHVGPYCAACETEMSGGYYRWGGECYRCRRSSWHALGAGAAGVAALAMLVSGPARRSPSCSCVGRLLARVSRDSAQHIKTVVKVAFVNLQILALFPVVLEIDFPRPFSDLLGVLSIVTVNMKALTTGLECYFPTAAGYYWFVMLVCLVPVVLCAALLTVGRLRPDTWASCFSWFVVIKFVMLPASTVAVFRVFSCEEFDDGSIFLRADYSVECDTPVHHYFEWFGILMILIWPLGVPLLFAFIIFTNRWELSEDDAARKANPLLDPIRMLFEGYQPKYFFWELVSTMRRLFLIGVLVVIAQGSVTQLAIGMFISLTTITLQSHYWPYDGSFDNVFVLIAEWLVYLALFLSLIGRLDPSKFQKDEGYLIGIVLSTCTAFMLGLAVLFVSAEVIVPDSVIVDRILTRSVHIETACDFSDTKFVTTLAAVISNHVSRANVLVYYYCSMETARKIEQKGGIPILRNPTGGSHYSGDSDVDEYDHADNNGGGEEEDDGGSSGSGVLFSLKGPHALKEGDPELPFLGSHSGQGFEVVMACSIPRWLLRPFLSFPAPPKGLGAGNSSWPLLLLPGNYVRTIVGDRQSSTWATKPALLLPGSCIERAFQLKASEDLRAPCLQQRDIVTTAVAHTRGRGASVSSRRRAVSVGRPASGRPRGESNGTSSKSSTPTSAKTMATPPTIPMSSAEPASPAPSTASKHPLSSSRPDFSFDSSISSTTRGSSSISRSRSSSKAGAVLGEDVSGAGVVAVLEGLAPEAYEKLLGGVRASCAEKGLAVLYHYTSPLHAEAILASGLKMSTQGQGDGGVYLSTLGPVSYDLGSQDYEDNLITDCFGKERLAEYRGKHKLDLCLVVGVDPALLQQAQGGRHHAKVVPKAAFLALGAPDPEGHYFLPPATIQAALLLDGKAASSNAFECLGPRSAEAAADHATQRALAASDGSAKAAADHLLRLASEREEETFMVKGPERRGSALGFIPFIGRRASSAPFIPGGGGGGAGGGGGGQRPSILPNGGGSRFDVTSPLRNQRSLAAMAEDEPEQQQQPPPNHGVAPRQRPGALGLVFGHRRQDSGKSSVNIELALAAAPAADSRFAVNNPAIRPAARLSHTPASAQLVMDQTVAAGAVNGQMTQAGALGTSLPDAAAAVEATGAQSETLPRPPPPPPPLPPALHS